MADSHFEIFFNSFSAFLKLFIYVRLNRDKKSSLFFPDRTAVPRRPLDRGAYVQEPPQPVPHLGLHLHPCGDAVPGTAWGDVQGGRFWG